MKKTQSLKFLAMSLIVGVAGYFANAWANYDVTLEGTTIFDSDGLKYKVTDFNKSTMEGKVEVSGNVLAKEASTIPFPADGIIEKNVRGTWNGANVDGKVKFTITSIGHDAFVDLKNLRTITIPGTVENIADDAFNNCGNMATMSFGENSQLTTLGDGIFGVSSIAEIDFSNCHNLDLSTGTPFIPENGEVNNQLKKVILPAEIENIGTAFAKCAQLETLDLSGTKVTTLAPNALEKTPKLKSITFPFVAGKTLKIGDQAMCGSGITEMTINTNMTTGSLTSSSFAGLALQKLTVNGELRGTASFPTGTFAEKCANKSSQGSLQTLVFNGDILAEQAIATEAISGMSKLATLTFGYIAKNGIAPSAFKGNGTTRANITFTGKLDENAIGNRAFENSYFSAITFEQDINTAAIGTEAFLNTKNNGGDAVVTFKGRLTNTAAVGENAFKGSQATKLVFEKEITEYEAVAEGAFEGASSLKTIDFKGAITKTGAVAVNAFKNAGNMAALTIEDITEKQAINSYAFTGASINSVVYNNVNATEAIAPAQFKGIGNLNTLTIKSDIAFENTIGAQAFQETGLTGITFEGDITVENAIVASSEELAPFANAGKGKKTTTLDLQANKIVESGIGAYAFANADINVIMLNSAATQLASNAFDTNSFLGIPALAKIYYSPAAANVKDHNFLIDAFNPDLTDVDILFYTNKAVQDSYEQTGATDLTPYRIKFILGIDVDLQKGADDKYYGIWVPQSEMYIIDKYQQDAEVTVYSAYYDDKTIDASKVGNDPQRKFNKIYMNPLRVQDNGKYVLNANEALLIRVNKDIDLVAKQNYEEGTLTPKYQFGGIQTFAGLNVRQANDLRYSPWQVYKAAVENNLKDAYGNVMSDYLIIRSSGTPENFQAARSIPAGYLYMLGTSNRDLRAKYSVYDDETTFENPWDNYNDSWYNRYNALLKGYAKLLGENGSKEDLINSLKGQIEDLTKQLAEANGEEQIAQLTETINGLKEQVKLLGECHEDDINLMLRLIDTRDAIAEAKAALAELADKEYDEDDVADVEEVANAKKALDDATKALADATKDMNKFTMGAIYVKMANALPIVQAKAQPQKDYDAALKAWQEKHDEYLKLVNIELNGETKTITADFIPVKVKSNVDAEGNEIAGFVGKKFYLKANAELKAKLIDDKFLAEETEDAASEAEPAPARRFAEADAESDSEGEELEDKDSRYELWTKNEEGKFQPTGIYVYVSDIEQPENDYAFQSYGLKTNYDLWDELEGPEQIQETVTIRTQVSPVFEGTDGKRYIWNQYRGAYSQLQDGVDDVYSASLDNGAVMYDGDVNELKKVMRPMTLADYMAEKGITVNLSEETTAPSRRFINPDELEPGSTSVGDEAVAAVTAEDYVVWRLDETDGESTSAGDDESESESESGTTSSPESSRRFADDAAEYTYYSQTVFKKDDKYYKIAQKGEGTALTYELVEVEVEESDQFTDIYAVGEVTVEKNEDGTLKDPIDLAGKLYYPVTVATNFAPVRGEDGEVVLDDESWATASEAEIPDFVGKKVYVGADYVTADGEIMTEAKAVKLLVKQDPDQTYTNPVMWSIYVDLKKINQIEGDYAFESEGDKYWSWKHGNGADEQQWFAKGTVDIVKNADGLADIETATLLEYFDADGNVTYGTDDECELCEAADALNEAAAALCLAANNLDSDDDDPCAELEAALQEATNKLQELESHNVDINASRTTLWEQLQAALKKWDDDKNAQLDGDETITDAVLDADNAEIARIQSLYDATFAIYEKYLKDVKEAKAAVDAAQAAYDECKNPIVNEYTSMPEDDLINHMKELEDAIHGHQAWTAEDGTVYNPGENPEMVESDALDAYLAAKYDNPEAEVGQRDDKVLRLAAEYLAAVLEATTDLAAKELTDATNALEAAIAAHEAVQNDIEAKENEHYTVGTEGEAGVRNITVIWNDESEVTGIMDAVIAKSGRQAGEGNGAIYNLQGVRVNGAAQKGVFIQNGKKIVK